MKKMIGIVLGVLVLCAVGCEKNNDNNKANNIQEEINDVSKQDETFGINTVKNTEATEAQYFEFEEVEGGLSITAYNGSNEIVVIPEKIEGKNVVSIGEMAFANNEDLRAVKLGNNIEIIMNDVFANCFDLEIVICGSGLKTIREYAFNYCTSLKNVELNEGLEEIGMLCFGKTDSLTELYVPSSVSKITDPFVSDMTNVTIIAEEGSAAEAYAEEVGIPYKNK